MQKELDARGRPCPQPVLMTKKAVDEGAISLTVLVDNEGAVQNVTRFAEKEGFKVSVERVGNDFRLLLSKEEKENLTEAFAKPAEIVCETGSWKINRGQVLYVKSEVIGRGSDELGQILVKSLFNTLSESFEIPEKVIFVNSGVKLACQGSDILESLKSLEKRGVEILSCGTCLNYYGLTEKIRAGRISNAFEILTTLLNAEKIIDLA